MKTTKNFLIFLKARLVYVNFFSGIISGAFAAALLFGAGLLFFTESPGINIGLYGTESAIIAEKLKEFEDWNIIVYDDRPQMLADVARRRLELAYEINGREINESVIVYITDATVMENVTNLLFSAVLLELNVGKIGARSLENFMEGDSDYIALRANERLSSGVLIKRLITVDGTESEQGAFPFRRLFHGLWALFAQLVISLMAMEYSKKDETSKTLIKINLKAAFMYALAGIFALFLLGGSIMLSAAALSGLAFGVVVLSDLPLMILFLAIIATLSYMFARALPETVFAPCVLLFFIFTVFLGNVVWNATEISLNLGELRFLFPTFYYMNNLFL